MKARTACFVGLFAASVVGCVVASTGGERVGTDEQEFVRPPVCVTTGYDAGADGGQSCFVSCPDAALQYYDPCPK